MGIAQYFSDGFYEKNNSQPEIGSIYWVPTSEIKEIPTLLAVKRASPTEHQVTDFEFVEAGSSHFCTKNQLPVKRLHLDDHTELIVSRAKRRPCVILGIAGVSNSDVHAIIHKEQRLQAQHLVKTMYLVAPMFSCSTVKEKGSFGPEITQRVRALKYPHLAYFPPFNSAELSSNPGSILRLDLAFSTYLSRGTEVTEWKVKEEVMDVIQDQLKAFCGLAPSDEFLELQEVLAECL